MKVNIAFTFLILGLSSCDIFELRGFFTSYENVNQRFEQSMEWNETHGYSEINLTNSAYTMHIMGDSHVGGIKNLNKFFKKARDMNAAAVVMAGDLTTGQEKDYKVFSSQLPSKDSLMYFPIAGNHDLYFDGWKSFYSVFGSSTYYFVVNTPDSCDLFICLDTGGGTLGDKQIDWFRKTLETRRNSYRHCFVITHVNLFRLRPTTSTNPMVLEIHALVELFIRHNVTMVISGHDHKRNSDILGKTTYIIMDALLDNNERASYLQLTVNKEDIDYSFQGL